MDGTSVRRFMCPICTMIVPTSKDLKVHLTKHSKCTVIDALIAAPECPNRVIVSPIIQSAPTTKYERSFSNDGYVILSSKSDPSADLIGGLKNEQNHPQSKVVSKVIMQDVTRSTVSGCKPDFANSTTSIDKEKNNLPTDSCAAPQIAVENQLPSYSWVVPQIAAKNLPPRHSCVPSETATKGELPTYSWVVPQVAAKNLPPADSCISSETATENEIPTYSWVIPQIAAENKLPTYSWVVPQVSTENKHPTHSCVKPQTAAENLHLIHSPVEPQIVTENKLPTYSWVIPQIETGNAPPTHSCVEPQTDTENKHPIQSCVEPEMATENKFPIQSCLEPQIVTENKLYYYYDQTGTVPKKGFKIQLDNPTPEIFDREKPRNLKVEQVSIVSQDTEEYNTFAQVSVIKLAASKPDLLPGSKEMAQESQSYRSFTVLRNCREYKYNNNNEDESVTNYCDAKKEPEEMRKDTPSYEEIENNSLICNENICVDGDGVANSSLLCTEDYNNSHPVSDITIQKLEPMHGLEGMEVFPENLESKHNEEENLDTNEKTKWKKKICENKESKINVVEEDRKEFVEIFKKADQLPRIIKVQNEITQQRVLIDSDKNDSKESIRYHCFYCPENFKLMKVRNDHMKEEHSDEKFLNTDMLFGTNNEQVNQNNGNYHNISLSCKLCKIKLENPSELVKHLRNEHGMRKKNMICPTCFEYFHKISDFKNHIQNIHPFECFLCGGKFVTRSGIKLHLKRHMKVKPYKCDLCTKSFVTNQKLKEHRNTHTGSTPIKCGLCEKKFKRYSNCLQHINSFHLKKKKRIKTLMCVCGEIFRSKKKLLWHMEIHNDKPYQCKLCSERFVHKSSVSRHMKISHNKMKDEEEGGGKALGKEYIKCPICNLTYLKTSLNAHMRIHQNIKPFTCDSCGKEFRTKWNLQLHKWTHTSRAAKPFKCDICNGAYSNKSAYEIHLKSHNEKNKHHACNICGRKFLRKYNCIRHVREHNDDVKKIYECDLCEKTFHRSYYLKEHMRTHTGERPFICHLCGKTTCTKSNHNKHIKTHANRDPTTSEL